MATGTTGPVGSEMVHIVTTLEGNPLPAEQCISPDVAQALRPAPHTFADRSTHAAGASR